MGITLTIVGGFVIISVIAVIGDIITKTARSRPSADQTAAAASLNLLSDRVEILERQMAERESRLTQLEGEVAFTTKLLEDKHR
ncbi:MAG TPA: hypothetical protein VMX33_09540 [bacterium]|nr:hypothetical protein [bacterium]